MLVPESDEGEGKALPDDLPNRHTEMLASLGAGEEREVEPATLSRCYPDSRARHGARHAKAPRVPSFAIESGADCLSLCLSLSRAGAPPFPAFIIVSMPPPAKRQD